MRKPDFENVLKVLNCEKPSRETLFEFYLNWGLMVEIAGKDWVNNPEDPLNQFKLSIQAFKNGGYDYATIPHPVGSLNFPKDNIDRDKSISLNDGVMITDRESFEKYPWQDVNENCYNVYDDIKDDIPDGMKLIAWGPGGVLENVIGLVGYDNLCFMTIEDEKLVEDLFNEVGSRIVKHYEICGKFDTIGALISNDDWGFKSQLMFSPDMFRKYVFPWHKKIVETIHNYGKPAILHSCGNLDLVMDEIIDDLGYDAKHSYEDNIIKVEDAYDKWGGRIAILGGIDLDFLCRSTPKKIIARSKKLFAKTAEKGGYALGSGNSIPSYVPKENYYAMISAINN